MAFNPFPLFLVVMNGPTGWKIVFALIATFVAGAVVCGLLASRAGKETIPHSKQLRTPPPLVTVDEFWSDLRLKPEQSEKIKPIVRQMSDEIGNLRSLALRETEGILSRGQDRMNPLLEPDQRTRLEKMIERYRQLVREEFSIPEPSISPTPPPVSADKEPPH